MTFKEKLRRGEATFEDFRAGVSEWHDEPSDPGPVHEYLGITLDEYFEVLKKTKSFMGTLNQRYKLAVAGTFVASLSSKYNT